MQVIDQINGSALFAQSAYSASVATKDSLGRNITATYITGVDLSEYAKRTDVLSSIESATSGKLDVSSYASVSSDFLTNEDLNGYATVSQLESTSGDITALIPDTSNFITNSSAEATYQPIGNYLSSNALEGYATNESLDTASSFLSGAIDYVSANAGKVYEGVSPIVVNNTEDKISADTWTFSAGSNVSFVDDNVNKITRIDCTVTGYNETVLYSNLTGRPRSPGQSITLSETPLNFDYIGIYLNGSTPTGTTNVANGYEEVPFEQISSSNTLQFIKGFCGGLGSDNAVFEMGCGYSGTSSTTWTKWYGYSYNVRIKVTDFNDNQHLNIWKVVGINRKY